MMVINKFSNLFTFIVDKIVILQDAKSELKLQFLFLYTPSFTSLSLIEATAYIMTVTILLSQSSCSHMRLRESPSITSGYNVASLIYTAMMRLIRNLN